MTECNQETFAFETHFSRRVEAGFTGGQITSDGGALLLRAAERKINLFARLASCFTDRRAAEPCTKNDNRANSAERTAKKNRGKSTKR